VRLAKPTIRLRPGEVIFVKLDRTVKTGEAAGMHQGILVIVPNALVGETVKARVEQVRDTYAVAYR
jgi:predicted RNA-binding protein with TRAM domain